MESKIAVLAPLLWLTVALSSLHLAGDEEEGNWQQRRDDVEKIRRSFPLTADTSRKPWLAVRLTSDTHQVRDRCPCAGHSACDWMETFSTSIPSISGFSQFVHHLTHGAF